MVYFGSRSWSGSTSNLPKYGNVILSVDKYSLMAGIKSASPTTRVTGYKSATEMADDCGTALTVVDTCRSAITYQQAFAHDSAYPNDPWVLRDSAGHVDGGAGLSEGASGQRRFGLLPEAVDRERRRA